MVNQNSNKRLAINLIANIVSYSVNILITFVLTPYLINTLGKEAYSFYPIANNFVAYIGLLSTALNSMSSRFVTISIVDNQFNEAKKYVSSVLYSNIIMGLILFVPMMLVVLFIDKVMNVPINIVASVRILFALVFASMLIKIFTSVFGIATYVKNRVDLDSLMKLISGILKIILFFVLFYFFTPTIIYVGIVAFIVAISELSFQKFYFRMLLPEIVISKKYFSTEHIKTLLASGCWNSINSMGNLLLATSSLIMANILYGAATGGIYSIVNTVPLFINGVISMLVGVFVPSITYSFALGNKSKLIHTVEKAQSIVGVLSCSVITVFISLSKGFFLLWTPSEDPVFLYQLSTITIIPHFFIGCLWPLTKLNEAANKISVPAIVRIILGVSNIVLVVVFYLLFHTSLVTICIVCSLLTIILVLIFMPLYASHYLNISYLTFYRVTIRMVISAVLLLLGFNYMVNFFDLGSWVKLISTGCVMGVFSIMVNFFIIFKKDTRHRLIVKFLKYIR